jgi:hypothetical protein
MSESLQKQMGRLQFRSKTSIGHIEMQVISVDECDAVVGGDINYGTAAAVAGVVAGSAALVAGVAVVSGAVAVAGVAGLVGGFSSFGASFYAAMAYF